MYYVRLSFSVDETKTKPRLETQSLRHFLCFSQLTPQPDQRDSRHDSAEIDLAFYINYESTMSCEAANY